MAILTGSYVVESTPVNLTSLGNTDFRLYNGSGTLLTKTGGGNLFTSTPWDFTSNTSRSIIAYDGFGGTGMNITTTDATPSDVTNLQTAAYDQFDNTGKCGWQFTAPAGLGERTIKIYIAHNLPVGQTETFHFVASVSGTGAPTPIDISMSTNNGGASNKTLTLTYSAGQAGQTITIGYYPEPSATSGYRDMGFRGIWISPEASVTSYPSATTGNPRFSYGTSTSWSACRSAANGDNPTYPSSETILQGELADSTYIIVRNGYILDTSSIPDNAIITGASLFVYSSASGDSSETTNPSNGVLVAYTPSSDTAPTSADYQSFGTTRLADTDVTRTSFIGSAGYKEWVLNAAGLAAISKTGNTKLGIRPSNDLSDSTAPTARSYALGYYAAQTGTANDPYLVVKYVLSSDITVAATGVASSSVVVGSVSNSRSISATGNSASATVGTVVYSISGDVTVAATGVTVSSTVNSVVNTNLFSVGITGPPATATVGTVVPSQSISIDLTGNSSSGNVGSLSKSLSKSVSGNSASATVQDISANEADTLSISGVTSSATVGSVSKSISKNITGSSTSATIGSVSPSQSISIGLSGVSSTATVQDVSTNDTDIITITGNASNANIGSVTPSQSISIVLSGVGSTADIGNVSYSGAGSVTVAATGVPASATVDITIPSISKSITGNSAGGFVGSVIRNITLAITGNSSIGNINSVSVSTATNITGNTTNATVNGTTENIIVGLSGVGSNATVGSVNAITDGAIQLSGVSTNADIGIVSPTTTIGISGVGASAEVGITEVITIASGNEAIADIGVVTPSISDEVITIELSGVSATGSIDNILPLSSLSILNIKLASLVGKVYSLSSSVSTDVLNDKVEKIYILTNSIAQG